MDRILARMASGSIDFGSLGYYLMCFVELLFFFFFLPDRSSFGFISIGSLLFENTLGIIANGFFDLDEIDDFYRGFVNLFLPYFIFYYLNCP